MHAQSSGMSECDFVFASNALANGGAARVMCLLANRYTSLGDRVGILSFLPWEGEYFLEESVAKEYSPYRGSSAISKIRRIRWIRDTVKRNPHAVVIAFEYFVNMQVLLACLGLPNRVIISERNDPARVGSGFLTDFVRKILYRTATILVCQTEEAAAYFSDKINKTIILNPINPDLPLPIQAGRRKTVVTFCRLEKQKNLGMLVQAFAKFHKDHPDYTLEIYGNGKERDSLISMSKSLQLSDFVSVMPARTDIHSVVRDCAIFVLPSDYEGLSNSMIEAMALGLPTICTDCPCGGARMVIESGRNGLLVPVGDIDALTTAMSQVADDPDFAYKIGRSGAEVRALLSFDQISSEWDEVTGERVRG